MLPTIHDKDEDNEAFLLHEIARQMRIMFDRRCQPLGLTRSQWRVLAMLRRNEGISQAGLAQLLEIEPISLVRLLDRMEKAKMIERRPDPADRRANRLYLGAKAPGILKDMRQRSVALRREALEGFSAAEHKKLLDFLRRMKANISNEGA